MSLTDQVYRRLRLDILTLRYGENEFLNESALADRYGTSKAPLREALHRLCMEGVLISYPRKGYLLAPVSQQEFAHAQRLRFLCEGYALELAAQAPLEARQALLSQAGSPYKMEENTAFHRTIAEMSGSRTLVQTVERLLSTVERTLSLRFEATGMPPQSAAVHLAIAQALVQGDADAAKRALADDLSLSGSL